jgi:hypothetical protein
VVEASHTRRDVAWSSERRRPDSPLTLSLAAPELATRYLAHALPDGAPEPRRVRLRMTGQIKAGIWLPFTATQWRTDSQSFRWEAQVALGPISVLKVTDRYRHGTGGTQGRLFGRIALFDEHGPDTVRSAAGRAALESVFSPASLLAEPGVSWSVGGPDELIAAWRIDSEPVELHMRIDEHGSVRGVSLQRWGNTGQPHYGYIPCGGAFYAERRFGKLVIPSEMTVGWWFGTRRYRPFFKARIIDAVTVH